MDKVKDTNFSRILGEASSRWVEYEPQPRQSSIAGIDSSWNKRAFQGLDLYVVDAVAVTSKNEIRASRWETNICSARSELLEAKAMSMEASILEECAQQVNMVCVDGSLVPRITRGTTTVASETLRVANSCSNAIFVSKTSDSRTQFGNLGSRAGDIYYYNHATKSPGFSNPLENSLSTPIGTAILVEFYARLREHTPIVKIEMTGPNSKSEPEIKQVLDMLCFRSVAGYPYCLRLAHENCKISNEDIDRLASIYGLQNEQGAREALNE